MDSYDENHPSKRRRQRSRSRERASQRKGEYVDEHELRSRSRSPDRSRRHEHDDRRHNSRSRSPSALHHHHHTHHHRHHRQRSPARGSDPAVTLPFSARQLSRSDFETFQPLFAQYLELQKNKRIEDLDEREIRGRWKSFVNKWNDGALADGWYDPEHFTEVLRRSADGRQRDVEVPAQPRKVSSNPERGTIPVTAGRDEDEDEDDDDDDYGPRLPGAASHSKHGPGIPNLQDLQVRREIAEEDRLERAEQLRLDRKADRKDQTARLEELVPRAEAGTRERQLEKKKEVNEKMRAFRERSPGAAEVNDGELMGGGDSVEDYKRMKASAERRKTEREIRKEEIARAKAEEREERLREYREKEDHAMAMLKELAKQRFG